MSTRKRSNKVSHRRRLFMKSRLVITLITLLCAAIASAQRGRSTTITVVNTNDSGPGSLRQALADASDGDTIDFDSSLNGQTIMLTSGQLNIDKDVTISGLGAKNLRVDGNAQSRVFYVNPGKTVTIDGLTIRNGYSDYGAGIYNNQALSLTVSNCTISGNSGGGILSEDAALTVSNCIVSDNSASYGGGISHGASNARIATLIVTNSTLSGNSGLHGGAIFNGTGGGYAELTITNGTISDNSADYGGGIYSTSTGSSQGGSSRVTLSCSTVKGNLAAVGGGGIYNTSTRPNSASLSVENSTISGNSAKGNGGGIYNVAAGTFAGASVALTNSTLSDNLATGNAGGIYNKSQGGFAQLVLGSTILNAGISGENIFNDAGTVISHGYNLASDDGGGVLIGLGDQINTDPLLGPLQKNGGPTFTHALLVGSPAINSGDPSFTPPPVFDQRGPGYDRVVNGRIDIGSFEVQPRHTPTPRPRPTPIPRSTSQQTLTTQLPAV